MGVDWQYRTVQVCNFQLYRNETCVGTVIVDQEWDVMDAGGPQYHVFTVLDETVNHGCWPRFNGMFDTSVEAFQALFDYAHWGINVQERHKELTPFDKVMDVLTDTWHSPEEAAQRIIDALEAQ